MKLFRRIWMRTKMHARIIRLGRLPIEAHDFHSLSTFVGVSPSIGRIEKFQHELSLRISFELNFCHRQLPSAGCPFASGLNHSPFAGIFLTPSTRYAPLQTHIILCLNYFRFRISIKITHCQWHLLHFMLNKHANCVFVCWNGWVREQASQSAAALHY